MKKRMYRVKDRLKDTEFKRWGFCCEEVWYNLSETLYGSEKMNKILEFDERFEITGC